jgi:hypothetical protein
MDHALDAAVNSITTWQIRLMNQSTPKPEIGKPIIAKPIRQSITPSPESAIIKFAQPRVSAQRRSGLRDA